MNRKKTLASAAAVSGILTVLFSQSIAHADTNVGNNTTFAAVGSDTSQDVMEGLSAILKDSNGNPLISNYKATAVGRTITTRSADADCTFTVPRNSGEGRDALSAALRGASYAGSGTTTPVTSPDMTGCVNIARSSSGGNPTTSPGVGKMTYIPFATDSVTYATLTGSSLPHKLNVNTLKALYSANGTPGSSACSGFSPLLPASGSGTRSFFATLLGLTDTATFGTSGSWGTCVSDTDASGTSIQEHDGRFLTNNKQVIPFSTAQFLAQQSSTITDIRGRASLGSIDFGASGTANAISPVTLQTTFGTGTRPLYNVVSTDAITTGTSSYSQRLVDALVGSSSQICAATSTIQQYGLAPNSTCGSTAKTNTN